MPPLPSMRSSTSFWKLAFLLDVERWHQRQLTTSAVLRLVSARLLVRLIPFARWSHRLGMRGDATAAMLATAMQQGRLVERAAHRTPLKFKCLPQAVALSSLLRQQGIPHRVVLAVRPAALRHAADSLHAWVEAGETIILGELAGPWIKVFSAPAP